MINSIKRRVFFVVWMTALLMFSLITLILVFTTGEEIYLSVDRKLTTALGKFSRWLIRFLRWGE